LAKWKETFPTDKFPKGVEEVNTQLIALKNLTDY